MLVFARDACPRALVNTPKTRVGVSPPSLDGSAAEGERLVRAFFYTRLRRAVLLGHMRCLRLVVFRRFCGQLHKMHGVPHRRKVASGASHMGAVARLRACGNKTGVCGHQLVWASCPVPAYKSLPLAQRAKQ